MVDKTRVKKQKMNRETSEDYLTAKSSDTGSYEDEDHGLRLVPSNGGSTKTSSVTTLVVCSEKLFISQPDPKWFGNESNTPEAKNWNNDNWLKSRFHFSFAEYYNPMNTNFGPIRVMNDDLVQPNRGFGVHPHKNMEIITYIVSGELTHEDSMGNSESLGRGSIQFMTAGTGVTHSEFNQGSSPLRFIQTWIVPRRRGLPTNYGSYDASKNCTLKTNTLQYLASDTARKDIDTPAKINQDVEFKAAELEMGRVVAVDIRRDRQAYLVCAGGTIDVDGKILKKHDGMEIFAGDRDSVLEIKAIDVEETENGQVAHFLLFDMASVVGSGRGDLEMASKQ